MPLCMFMVSTLVCSFHLMSSHVATYYVGPPSITFISNHTMSIEGHKVHLICTAVNDASAPTHSLQVNWYFKNQLVMPNGTRITIHNETDTSSRQLKSTLLLDPVHPSDHGEYTCRASNHHNSYSESRTKLTIKCMVYLYASI